MTYLWKGSGFSPGYVYLMKNDNERTISDLRDKRVRVIDRCFFKRMVKRGKSWYHGWIKLEKPMELLDAMDAGLVPVFREDRDEKRYKKSEVEDQEVVQRTCNKK